MSGNDVEVDYEFHNDAAFMQVELSLEDKDVEEKSLSQIRPTLQALNSPNMWIGDTGATRHYTKYKQGGIDLRPSMSRTRGIKQLSQAWKLIFQECIVTSTATTSLQLSFEM